MSALAPSCGAPSCSASFFSFPDPPTGVLNAQIDAISLVSQGTSLNSPAVLNASIGDFSLTSTGILGNTPGNVTSTLADISLASTAAAPFSTMLIVEDGSVVAGANTYILTSDVTAYANLYGFSFEGTPIELEQAILRAGLFLKGIERRYCGDRVSIDQSLAWPWSGVKNVLGSGYLPIDQVPDGIRNAQAEAAIVELADPGVLTRAQQANPQNIKRQCRRVGPLETETEFSSGTSTAQTQYTRVMVHLSGLLCSGSGAGSRISVRGH